MKVLYGVSPIGLGHATRSTVVVGELERLGADVRVFSGGKAADFLRDEGVKVDNAVEDAVPHVASGEMGRVASWYVRSWLAQRKNVRAVGKIFDSFAPDLVVCDEEFSGLAVAGLRGVKRALIADELSLGFARTWVARQLEARVEGWYKRLQEDVDLLVIPEEGTDSGNRKYVGPIVRPSNSTCVEVRSRHGIPPGSFVLLSLSGTGIGRELFPPTKAAVDGLGTAKASLVVTGNRGEKFTGGGVLDLGVVKDNQELIGCADLVVSMAGKSTMDEASATGTPIIAIPIRHHAEQERNAEALGYSHGDVARLAEIVPRRFGQRGDPKKFDGGARAARLILNLGPANASPLRAPT
jgi:UDP-N-acetylglucosamine--N-acetylmuramyl-(pentapeptide) pyrophosphoryl-undecaprenol N-acetylglucosamine transferase